MPAFDQIVDEFGLRRRFRRQGRHHPGARAAFLPFAEQPVGFRLQLRGARPRQRRRRIGGARFAGQAPERRDQRIERQRDVALAAAERREAPRREPVLQVGEVVLAQRDIMGKIENPGRDLRLVRADAPGASELRALCARCPRAALSPRRAGRGVLRGRFRFFQPWAPLRMSESSAGITHFPARPVFDAQI